MNLMASPLQPVSPPLTSTGSTCPILADQRVVGYLSVRSEPARNDIEVAQALYQRIGSGAAAGSLHLGLRHGRVVRHGVVGRLSRWAQLPAGPVAARWTTNPNIWSVVIAADSSPGSIGEVARLRPLLRPHETLLFATREQARAWLRHHTELPAEA